MTRITDVEARKRAHTYLARAGVVLTPEEAAAIEVADFGLDELETTGLQLVTYVNTERVCAKELVLFPRQTCPEHLHPPVAGEPGEEGAVVSEFSTRSRDESDMFTDPEIRRLP